MPVGELEELSIELTQFILPWISVLLSIVLVFWFKDFATSLAKGLKFKQNPLFNEGDKCLLEGEEAIIVKIGIRSTVFGLYTCLLYTSPSPRDRTRSRMPSSA